MTIEATYIYGWMFGEEVEGQEVFETKVFSSIVEYEKWMRQMEEFGDEDKVTNVKWKC